MNNAVLLICDLNDRNSLAKLKTLEDIEIVIHLASTVPPSFREEGNFVEMVKNNLFATKNLFDYLPKLKQICLASSRDIYGKPKLVPIMEDYPCNPCTIYGLTKFFQEKYVKYYSLTKNITSTILRFTTIFGPNETSSRVIPEFIKACLSNASIHIIGNGKEMRDFVFVDDAVKSIEIAIEKGISSEFNITGGQPISIKDLASLIVKLVGRQTTIDFKSSELSSFDSYLSSQRTEKIMGFKPEIPLHEGLKKEISYFANNLKSF